MYSPLTTAAAALISVLTLAVTCTYAGESAPITRDSESVIPLSSECGSTMPVIAVSTTGNVTSYTVSISKAKTGYHGLYFDEEGTYELTVHNPSRTALFSVKMSCNTDDNSFVVQDRTRNNEHTEQDVKIILSAWKFASFIVVSTDKEIKHGGSWNATFTVSKVGSTGKCPETQIETIPHLGTYDTATGAMVLCNISGSLTLRQGNWHSVMVKGDHSGAITLDVCPNKVDISQPLSVVPKVFTDSKFECPETPDAILQYGTFKNTSCKVSWVPKPNVKYIAFISSSSGIKTGAYTLKLYGNAKKTSIVNDACELSDTRAGVVEMIETINEQTRRDGTRWFGFRSTKYSQKYKLEAYCSTNTQGKADTNTNLNITVWHDCNESAPFADSSRGHIELMSEATYNGQPYKVAVDGCDGKLKFEIRPGYVDGGISTVSIVFIVITIIVAIIVCVLAVVRFVQWIRNRNQRPYANANDEDVNDAFDDDDIEFDFGKEINDSTDRDSLIINSDY